jgi:predicted Zn-dependent peptidase
LKLPPIERLQLSNGLPVLLLEKHEVPLVQIDVLVKVGSTLDPAGKSGLADMTAAMLDEGAGKRSALELAEEVDFLGARLSTLANFHHSTISLHTPLRQLDPALALMADVVRRPTFVEEELERQRAERLTTLVQWRDEPSNISSVAFSQILFGKDHPYGMPRLGNEASLRAISVTDLQQFHTTYFHPGNAVFIVVGDVKADGILPKLEALFGDWKSGDRPSLQLPKVEQVKRRQIYLVDKPGAAQSVIRIGRIGVPRQTEDYDAIVVMNTILGGSFAARLNQNLREEHGYTYGAGSAFDFRPSPGPFWAGASVQTAVSDKALTEFMKELRGILEPVPNEELTRAKNYVALGFPSDFQTVGGVARRLRELVLYDLPDDYFNGFIQNVLSVSRDDVERVAKKYIDPDKLAIVIVGDRETILKGLEALDLGPVRAMTLEDVLGPAPTSTEE